MSLELPKDRDRIRVEVTRLDLVAKDIGVNGFNLGGARTGCGDSRDAR